MTVPADGWLPSAAGSDLANAPLPTPYEATYREGGNGTFQSSEELDAVVVEEAGESAVAEGGIDTDGDTMLRAMLTREHAYGVVLLDSFDEAGVSVERIGPEGFFFGRSGGNDLLEFGQADDDDGVPIISRILHRAVAPRGAAGEAIFTNVRPTITYTGVFEATFTPIIDGEEISSESETISRFSVTQQTETLELALTRGTASRHHLRGTWFRLQVEVEQLDGAGHIALDGIEIEFEPVRESLPELTFHQESISPASTDSVTPFYFGVGDSLGRFGGSRNDLGNAVEAVLHSNPIAPAGSGGECIFTNLYLALTRANTSDVPLNVVAIVDEERHAVATRTLTGISTPKLEVLEVPLTKPYAPSGTELSRQRLRGSWLEVELDTDGSLPDGDIVFETAEVAYEVVQESEADIGG